MTRAFRWLFRLFMAGLALFSLAGIGVYYFASRSLPDYNASHSVRGLDAPVEIVRDTHNVPHVFGASDADVFFGLGYAHAQDRLWQMLLLRRTAQGRLSELFGARTLPVDDLLRRFDFYTLAQSSVSVLQPETRAALEAYARGINARVEEVNTKALGRGAPEFWLFAPEIAPWQPADSVALVKLMALQLSTHIPTEVLRARLSLTVVPEKVGDLMPDAPGDGLIALPDFAELFPGLRSSRTYASASGPSDPLSPVRNRILAGGSNAWVADATRSAAGGALLANDPHLEYSAPSLWYLARIELASGGVIGGTIPGIPAVLAGRSDILGWGVTSAYADDQDILLERLNPDNPEEYETPDGFKAFETRRSVIRVHEAAPVTVTLRWSDNGPILTGEQYNLETITPPGHVAALSWTALSPADTSMDAALGVMRAATVDEALTAAERFIAPAQNLLVTGPDGIAHKLVGALPRRSARHQSLGRLPVPGWRAENRWQGALGYSANPETRDPESGLLGNTNNKIIDRPFPLHVSYDWGDTQRIQRWETLMSSRDVHTRESFIEAQLDTISPAARALLPLVARDLWFTSEAAPVGTVERARKTALDLLGDWNGEMSEHLPEPLIYSEWMRTLQTRLIRDELGPLAASFTHLEPLFLEKVFRDVDGASAWCDVAQSVAQETCLDQARAALDEALLTLQERYGSGIAGWRWGDAHEATHDHSVLGGIPFLGAIVNIRQSTSGGDFTLNRGLSLGTGPNPWLNADGPGYRGVYDFADPDSSVFITATGQSGHPLSRHYDDLGELWRRGEYIPMSLDPDLARGGAIGVTRLVPQTTQTQ